MMVSGLVTGQSWLAPVLTEFSQNRLEPVLTLNLTASDQLGVVWLGSYAIWKANEPVTVRLG